MKSGVNTVDIENENVLKLLLEIVHMTTLRLRLQILNLILKFEFLNFRIEGLLLLTPCLAPETKAASTAGHSPRCPE